MNEFVAGILPSRNFFVLVYISHLITNINYVAETNFLTEQMARRKKTGRLSPYSIFANVWLIKSAANVACDEKGYTRLLCGGRPVCL
jgi:hypothetical protein